MLTFECEEILKCFSSVVRCLLIINVGHKGRSRRQRKTKSGETRHSFLFTNSKSHFANTCSKLTHQYRFPSDLSFFYIPQREGSSART